MMISNKKLLLTSILVLFLGLASIPCRGQFLWLGFQAGGGLTWFSQAGQGSSRLSAGAGAGFGFFIRYGTRPYYQVGIEWLYSTNQMNFQVKPGTTKQDNVPFHNFKIPVTAGYEIIHKPRFKWRVGGGPTIGWNTILSSNTFNFTQQDIMNPQFGVIAETGIQYMNSLVLVDYNYSFSRFFDKDAGTYGVDVYAHLQVFALKVGMQF